MHCMFCIFPKSEPVAEFLNSKMRKKGEVLECTVANAEWFPGRSQDELLTLHDECDKTPCHCFLITLLPLFPVELVPRVFSVGTPNKRDMLFSPFPGLSLGLCVGMGPQRSSSGDCDSVHGAD